MLEGSGGRDMNRHFTQLVHRAGSYVDADGEEREVTGWRQAITLTR
jgi:hypothetical protein